MAKNQQNRKTKTNATMIIAIVIGVVLGQFLVRSGSFLRGGSSLFIVSAIILILFVVFAFWVIISSARKTPKATQLEDAEAKKFLPLANKGIVYVFRDQLIATAKAFPIDLSGQTVGWIKGKNFIRLELPAGSYTLSGNKSCREPFDFTIQNGQILFVEQEIVTGMMRGGYLYAPLNDDDKNRMRISRCRLIKLLSTQ